MDILFPNDDLTPCLWTENEYGQYKTSCGNIHEFFEDTPQDNAFQFCPYCGSPLTLKQYEEEEE